MLKGPFRDPMQVPFVFIDTPEAAHAAAEEWRRAALNAADTETAPINFDEVKVHGVARQDWRVHSHACGFTSLDGIDPDGLITEHLPDELAARGIVGVKVYVIDTGEGYVEPSVFGGALSELDVYVWNATFERKVFKGGGFRAKLLIDLMLFQANLDAGAEFGSGKIWYTSLAKAAADRLGWDLEGKGGIQLSYRRVADLPTLSVEQQAYAAQDAIATLLLVPPIVAESDAVVTHANGRTETLTTVGIRSCKALPFLDEMTMTGVPLVLDDPVVAKDKQTYAGWRGYIAHAQRQLAAAETRLTELLDDKPAQGMFTFDEDDDAPQAAFKVAFNPGSSEEIRDLLNERIPDEVKAYTSVWLEHDRDGNPGEGRLLREGDTLDKNALKLIGGELCEAINEWSKWNKLLTDCGLPFIEEHVNVLTGRLHPTIKQSLVATGRLAMEDPAMQNRPPVLKRFHRVDGMVVLYADMSQAELRTLAHMSDDEVMKGAYIAGEDLHTATARVAFKLDMARLMTADKIESSLSNEELIQLAIDNRVPLPDTFNGLPSGDDPVLEVGGKKVLRSTLATACVEWAGLNRSKAKVPNFGIAYGLSAPALRKNLALQGVDVSLKEAQEVLAQWLEGYKGVGAWLQSRVDTVMELVNDPPAADYWATMRLATWHKPVTDAFFRTKRQLDRSPSNAEIAERLWNDEQLVSSLTSRLGHSPDDAELATERERLTDFVRWVRSFRTPVVVMGDGKPVQFASYTLGGRRRLFQVATSDWFEAIAFQAMESDRPLATKLRREFASRHNLTLETADGRPLKRGRIPYALPKKSRRGNVKLRESFARYIFEQAPPDAFAFIAKKALANRLRRSVNQFRNHPIQGTVGDAAELAYALLDERVLQVYPDVKPMLTVHDSIFLLAPAHLAREVAPILQSSIEEALAYFCPSVPTVADAVIAYSADEADVVPEEVLIAAEQEFAARAA